jgi:YfhD-like protein
MAKKNQQNKNIKPDGLDIEFSQELADQDDLEAQARSKAADERAKARNKKY